MKELYRYNNNNLIYDKNGFVVGCKNPKKVDWDWISYKEKLSEKFIEKYQDKVAWYLIFEYQKKLSEKFIEKHKGKVAWYLISKYQTLSEEFIEKHKDKVAWRLITIHQKLSEEFIEKHKDKIDWGWVYIHQKLSEKFIEKYKNKVVLNWLSNYRKECNECNVSLCLDCGFVMLENSLCQNCHDENLKTLKMTYKEFQNLPDFPSKEDLVEFLI